MAALIEQCACVDKIYLAIRMCIHTYVAIVHAYIILIFDHILKVRS